MNPGFMFCDFVVSVTHAGIFSTPVLISQGVQQTFGKLCFLEMYMMARIRHPPVDTGRKYPIIYKVLGPSQVVV